MIDTPLEINIPAVPVVGSSGGSSGSTSSSSGLSSSIISGGGLGGSGGLDTNPPFNFHSGGSHDEFIGDKSGIGLFIFE
ncbi:hypothetical protein HDU76_009590, partial [Blyttiomyces sp. JEL0837]